LKGLKAKDKSKIPTALYALNLDKKQSLKLRYMAFVFTLRVFVPAKLSKIRQNQLFFG